MKKKVLVLMIAFIAIIAVVSTSYGYLRAEKVSSNPTGITLTNFGVVLLTDMTPITISNTYPMLDTEGLKNSPTTFQIKNTGGIIASYKVSLVDKDDVISTMQNNDVRYQLKKTSSLTGETEILEIANLLGSGLIDEGSIEVGEVFTYELIMWIDIDANPNNKSFSKVVLVEGMQVASLDESGANFPELAQNMIPVYYDKTSDTEGVWRVADKKNLNETYKWFDYNDYMWANAVTVHKDKIDEYVAHIGSEGVTETGKTVSIATNYPNIYTSGNYNIHSTTSSATFTFTTTSDGTLTFDYSVSSQASYDKYTITINDGSTTTTLVSAISGVSSGSKEVTLTSGLTYTLVASYVKNSSTNSNEDKATISNINITSTLDDTGLVFTPSATYPFASDENLQYASSTYTYDATTGLFTLENPTLLAYDSSRVGYFTCNSNINTTCYSLYEIKTIDENNIVTSVDVYSGSTKGEFGVNIGQEVKMEDITSMWVWIPRYKYTIFNGNNESSQEQQINVMFEHGTYSTGTVKCVDKIASSTSSQTCTDSVNGSIVNGKSTYNHPAFTFGSEELTGFWMAKFEMSTDDTTCISSKNSTNCNKLGMNVLIKPSSDSLIYQTISTEFANIRNMETYGNIHGFSQSENATTYLNSNSYLTGEIQNDNNDLDIHMLKNMEWGAVTYLSQSQYGKWSNPLYTGDYRRVYKNNYYTSTNYVYKTGYSGGTYNSNYSTSSTYLYNNMTSAGTGQGYRGPGASTTGTIYGVYDMNGGAYEFVMGNMATSAGAFNVGSAATWTGANIPIDKYYDKYSYNSSSSSQTRGKLGDSTKEVAASFGSTSGGWGGSYLYMPYSSSSRYWFSRGGYASSSSYFGIFNSYYSNGAATAGYSTRPVLTISRDMPWLNE